jgi:Uma2 family endonuclease
MTTAELLERYGVDDPADPDPVPKGYERIDGKLVEKPDMGYESSWVVSELYFLLRSYLAGHPIGVAATSDAAFACFPARPRTVRKPDISVILCDPATFVPPRQNCRTAPDLAVEVISRRDTVYDLDRKVQDFLRAGTKLVWVVNPVLRTVLIRRADGTVQLLADPAELTGEGVLPGFASPLAAFLPRTPAAPPGGAA